MNTSYLLLEDIAVELKTEFATYKYDTKEGTTTPNIWIGHAPPKRSMPAGAENTPVAGDPPFIVVRYLEDEDSDDRNKAGTLVAKIGILCCVYNKDSYEEIKSGYADILNMADKVLLTLLRKRFWGNKVWWLDDDSPIKRTCGLQKELSSIYEAGVHEHPFYGMAVVAAFKTAAIARPVK